MSIIPTNTSHCFIADFATEIHFNIIEHVSSAPDLLALAVTCKYTQALVHSLPVKRHIDLLRRLAENALPSNPDLVKDTLTAVCSDGKLHHLIETSTNEDRAIPKINWSVPNDSRNVWSTASYASDDTEETIYKKMASFRILAKLSRDAEAIADYIQRIDTGMIENEEACDKAFVGSPSEREEVLKTVWEAQRLHHRLDNLEMLQEDAFFDGVVRNGPDTFQHRILVMERIRRLSAPADTRGWVVTAASWRRRFGLRVRRRRPSPCADAVGDWRCCAMCAESWRRVVWWAACFTFQAVAAEGRYSEIGQEVFGRLHSE